MIENLPKGAYPDPEDFRDFKASAVLGAAPSVDWSTPYDVEVEFGELHGHDQGSSLSCVAQAWSYYQELLRKTYFSVHDLYARIRLPQGGAYIRDGGKEIVNNGHATLDREPDPNPETEANMSVDTDTTNEKEFTEASYFIIDGGIDQVAAAIKQYHGVVGGVTGSNPGWQNMLHPRPPRDGEATWGHALYFKGYHLHNGKKCIVTKSSWYNTVREHHIDEDYFASQYIFNPWTLIPRKDLEMSKLTFVHKAGTNEYGFLEQGVLGSTYHPAADEEHIKKLAALANQNILTAEGKVDFSRAVEMTLPA